MENKERKWKADGLHVDLLTICDPQRATKHGSFEGSEKDFNDESCHLGLLKCAG